MTDYRWDLDRREAARRRLKARLIYTLAPLPGIALCVYIIVKGR
jgi:hypothetical protein